MSGHSPLPWVVTNDYVLDSRGSVVGRVVPLMCEAVGIERHDAKFIARACNSHHELLAALKAITDCFYVGYRDPAKFCEHVEGFMQEARAAIAKAEKG